LRRLKGWNGGHLSLRGIKDCKYTVKTTVEYLKQLKFKDLTDLESSIAKIKLDNKEELLEIRRPSTGRFKGFIYGLFTSGSYCLVGIFAFMESSTFFNMGGLKPRRTISLKKKEEFLAALLVKLNYIRRLGKNWSQDKDDV